MAYLLYLDESGQHGGDYFVLAGAAVFERQTYWVADSINRLQRELLPNLPVPTEFHASAIRGGSDEPWSEIERRQRYELIDRTYAVLADNRLTLFATAIERGSLPDGADEYEYAFEDIAQRFDYFLKRAYHEDEDPQRGLIIVAESEYRRRIETLAQKVLRDGTRWGQLHNLAEIPLFTPSANSRLLQVADFCANAVYGRYENGYTRHFDGLMPLFDQQDNVYCGLNHYCGHFRTCHCPACLSRRVAGRSDSGGT